MHESFLDILAKAGVSPAEYAVLFHILDTVVTRRKVIAQWTFDNLPNNVSSDITLEECRAAIDSLLTKKLVIELTQADIAADLARWKAEPIPIGFGVDLRREEDDIDLTEDGYQRMRAIHRQQFPNLEPRLRTSFNHDDPKLIRVLGETAEGCERAASVLLERGYLGVAQWLASPSRIDPLREIGPWWHGRFERVPTGFEIAIHA